MDGILLIDKPMDYTSHDVVAQMRGILRTRKIGHAGTLDPMATGVLPLFIGVATKAVDMIPDQSKCYEATFRLGISTDTQDITGTVLEEREVGVGAPEVKHALLAFSGDLQQIPPMYSAVQIDGKRLYQLARQGKVIDRPSRPITIHSIELLGQAGDEYTISVHCSGGTYLRTLCHDLGELLGCGATLTKLIRTKAGVYSLADCISIEETVALVASGDISQKIKPVESVFFGLPRLEVTARQGFHLFNGVRMTLEQFPLPADGRRFAVYGPDDVFIGPAVADEKTGQLLQEKLFVREVTW